MENNHKWRLFERIVADFMSSSKTKGKTGKEVIHQRLLDITQGRSIVLTNNKKAPSKLIERALLTRQGF